MAAASGPAGAGLASVLRAIVGDYQRTSEADIVSFFLYDEARRRYFAPFAAGQPEDTLAGSLTDMTEQLGRYYADREQGKAPEAVTVQQYGSTVWLTLNRRPLIAPDAEGQIGSTFIRRYGIASTVGLPLMAGHRLIGVVYLNYRQRERLPEGERLTAIYRFNEEAGSTVQFAIAEAQRSALEGISRLTAQLTRPARDDAGLRRTLSIGLSELLIASGLDAGAVYLQAPRHRRLELLTAHAPAAAPPVIEERAKIDEAMEAAMSGLHAVATFPLGGEGDALGYLVLLDRDPLATVRRAPAADVMLRSAASLIGGALAGRRLIGELEQSGRLLGALGSLTDSMIRPGSSRQDVLEAVVAHLTDATVPEFDFHFASVYVLVERQEGALALQAAAGSARIESIDASQADGRGAQPGRHRVPRWTLDQERVLAESDVLVHVARQRQAVVVGSAAKGDEVLAGAIPEHVTWTSVPAVRSDGTTVAVVPAGLIGAAQNGSDMAPFTLAGDIFESSGHGDLIRVFLPFGAEASGHATGVLEVGYHRAFDRRPDWGQIEALRAAAAQVGVALETARLYEEARHHAERLELSADVSRAIASSIDLDQTLRLVAGNLARLLGTSLCQIALYEEDGEGWFGAAASDQEDEWRRQRGERPQASFLFDVLDRGRPLVIEDVAASGDVDPHYVELFGVRSLMALPLVAGGQPIGAAVLAERGRQRTFTADERQLVQGIADQAAVAIKNARLHALAEEERHIQKDFILIGMGQWGQKAYQHLQTLKQFFNFRVHVIEHEAPGARERLADREAAVRANGDAFYWDSPQTPAHDQLEAELEPSPYVITYVATPAATHLPTVAAYYDLSNVVLIEKPLGAPPEEYREWLDSVAGGVEIVAADHYYFKLEVRLLQGLLAEERTLRDFLDSVDEIRVEILEEQALTGAAADIGVVADLVPHAFAIISLFSPIDRIELDAQHPLRVGRHEGMTGSRESYAQLNATIPYKGRRVRLVIDAGKGVENAKWIRLSGERPAQGGRSPFYKFDFGKGEAIDGTQATVRAATRRIREPGVPDNAHLTMLRHVIEKRRPAVGILSIREALRANQRIRELEAMAVDLVGRGECVEYPLGARPDFTAVTPAAAPGPDHQPAPPDPARAQPRS